MNDAFTLGLVIPCYNEEEVLSALVAELKAFSARQSYTVRCLFIDDGSTDGTSQALDTICESEPNFACLHLSRNFGHQTAITAGLRHSQGDAVVIIDADLQDPLDAIPLMIAKWKEGYDVVYGVRKNRKESLLLRASYSLFYRFLKAIAQIEIPVDSGDFSLLSRKVVDCINSMPERRRFVRGLRAWSGFRQCGVSFDRNARRAGASKYSVSKLVRLAASGIISFSSFPLRLATWLGCFFSLFAFLFLVFAVFAALFMKNTPSGWASLVVLLVFFSGIQLIVLGIIGEYISQIVDEVKGRPLFIVSGKKGWLENQDQPAKE